MRLRLRMSPWNLSSLDRKSRITGAYACSRITSGTNHHRPSLALATVAVRPYSTKFPADTSVLFLSNLLPEPNASAAGVRTSFLLQKLAQCDGITSIHYATAASPKETDTENDKLLKALGVHFHLLPPNRSELMKNLLDALPRTDTMLVIFDRFYAEEMYSFHLHEHCPHAVLVMDMQDMHSLRHTRQDAIRASDRLGPASLDNLPINVRPSIDDPRLLRELASIHRSDLTIACSPAEMDLLNLHYQIPTSKLCVAPLFGDDNLPSSSPDGNNSDSEEVNRHDFVFVGGFRHDPNVDAVHQLKRLWPRIRAALVDNDDDPTETVRLHIYGAYCPDQLKQRYHNPKEGFLMHGYHESLRDILWDKKVMLAPLRFGAGLKGKIVDAWKYGVPVVTTTIGSEGMHVHKQGEGVSGVSPSDEWGGKVALSDDDFVKSAVELYRNPDSWRTAQQHASSLLSKLYGDGQWEELASRLCQALEQREENRAADFSRATLWHQSCRSTEFFSKYIEYKEQHKHQEKEHEDDVDQARSLKGERSKK
jgi:glycosyltransferase involved in cell wall biosynthesis